MILLSIADALDSKLALTALVIAVVAIKITCIIAFATVIFRRVRRSPERLARQHAAASMANALTDHDRQSPKDEANDA